MGGVLKMKKTKTRKNCQSLMRCPEIVAQGLRYAGYALLGYLCSLSLSASAATVYLNGFQTAVVAGWSSADNTIGISQVPNTDYDVDGGRHFLGEFSNGTVSLSLTDLPEHTTTTVSFSLYLIRSWDGNDTTVVNGDPLGPDTWSLGVAGGPTLLSATFSNGNRVAGQSYSPFPGALSCNAGYNAVYPAGTYNPMTGASECYSLGYTFTDPNVTDEPMDSVYSFSFMFAHNASDLVLNFSAANLQGIADESWGLDNVQVSVAPVPVPPAVWLFGSGLLGLLGIARQK
jgi:hypothetical protein